MNFLILSPLPPPTRTWAPLFWVVGWGLGGGGGLQKFVLSGIRTLVCETVEGQTVARSAIRYRIRIYAWPVGRKLFVHSTTVLACTDEVHHRL